MTPRSLRSKAFILVLTVLHSRATAFTIRRASDPTNYPDLKAAESKLTVKNDLTHTKPYTIQSDSIPLESAQSNLAQDAATTKGISQKAVETTSVDTTVETTPAVTTVSATKTTSSTASYSQETEITGREVTETSSATETANEITSYDKVSTPSLELNTTNVNTVATASGNNSALNTTDNTTAINEMKVAAPVPPKDITAEPKTEVSNNSYSTEPVNKGANISDTSSTKGIDGNRQNEITTTSELTTPTLSTKEKEELNSETIVPPNLIAESKATENVAEELTGADSAATATPYWKKYTVIDRKRTTPQINLFTSTEHDLIKSGTAQTVSFQKANIPSSGIQSLDQLSNELLSLNKDTTMSLEKTESTAAMDLSTTSAKSSEKTTATSAEDNITKLEIVTSKRAGFLDYSARPTLGTEPAVVKKEETLLHVTQNNETIPTIETTSKKDDGLKRSSMASQSQLAEDAIQEELMKEETLSNYKDAERQRQDNLVVKAKEKQSVDLSVAGPSSEDKLSVKPISIKPQRLYTVSPNYKPLKKLDIQPPKPNVRNPDDNSWRNESLSSLGIVFKANNSSKPFTEVLKNKTETELNSTLSTYSKDDTPELRERLEKIAEQRKSKKKKTNQFGETVYTDYEESISVESLSATKIPETTEVVFAPITPPKEPAVPATSPPADSITTLFNFDIFKTDLVETTTNKAKKLLDEYETDEEEPDYTLANIDLKRFITPPRNVETPAPPPQVIELAKPPTTRTYLPERKPTIQYFPPREKQKVVIQDYDTEFQRKVNAYTYKDIPTKVTQTVPHTVSTQPTFRFPKNKFESPQRPNDIVSGIRHSQDLNKNLYLRNSVPADQESSYLVPTDSSYHRGSYVIKHLRDFIDEVVKGDENPNLAVTDEPIQGVTTNVGFRQNSLKPPADYYDYEAQFKKEVIDRFVDNFNQNSDRFKADFPLLYNTTVVHSNFSDASKQASSSAFMKRLYENARAIQGPKQYEPPCDRTVELSPAYELHYYVPEEEEKEVYQPKPVSVIPYTFRL